LAISEIVQVVPWPLAIECVCISERYMKIPP
jgi:hypothetical protein